jgi:hypothetical protein
MNRPEVNLTMREIAERLSTIEANAANISEDNTDATCRVCEKLRRTLTMLTGTVGFASLLSRALTMAKREAPALSPVWVKEDGSLEGLSGEAALAHPVLIAHLLNLLTIFIGEALTIGLLYEIWPELPGLKVDAPRKESE